MKELIQVFGIIKLLNAIRLASENGHSKIVELLLEDERVDPSVWDNKTIK
jgi:hypothetical protein